MKEEENIQKYDELKRDIKELCSVKKVDVVPVVTGALGAVSSKLELWIYSLGIKLNIEHPQTISIRE